MIMPAYAYRCTGQDDASSLAWWKFRKKARHVAIEAYDNFKDICGVKALSELSKFAPPYFETPLFWHFRLILLK